MFDRVLVGVDGRPGGRDAIALARRLAPAPDALLLANVYGAVPRSPLAIADGETEWYAHQLLTSARIDAVLDCPTITRADSSPARGLHRLAETEAADLLVVGSSHRGALGRVLLGDDTLATLDRARCAVAIAPRGYVFASPAWRTVGVGDDGSRESALALAAARRVATAHDAAIYAVAVVPLQAIADTSDEPGDWTAPTAAALRSERQRMSGVPGVHGYAAYGEPAEELARLAHSVDLLVVGSRGRGPVGRFVAGSVSRHLARDCACPLLILPRAIGEPAPGGPAEPSPGPPVPAGRSF